ncbi:DUF4192 domain-containing protein [Bifidobacterium aerophilum]|uniref:DUF4192 domain-containing protein n=1 Tax=Bifidobacterium aerophilum TaxID=1798155 RepID=A0A6N9Z5G2_9BIFI|nr:DUF4192 domain-containing protein [Bifidobacterium aerophilum]NEG89584.1 DUF4192 domain-containing protein [Bifidobacterium aerophilum]
MLESVPHAPRGDGMFRDGIATADGPCCDSEDATDCMLSRDNVAMLAAGMAESLPIRDAMIVSLVTGRSCDRRMMIEIASRPHSAGVRRRMSSMMIDAFHGAGPGPDPTRCTSGVTMLAQIADAVPERWGVQPRAAIAYVLWWMDDDAAALHALECLAEDDGCTLAGIVLSMVERGIRPAWCG